MSTRADSKAKFGPIWTPLIPATLKPNKVEQFGNRCIKLWGNARVVVNNPNLFDRLRDPSLPGKLERTILFEIEA
jgi:hypothetical protein